MQRTIISLAVSLTACSSSGGDTTVTVLPLTCEVIANNCWTQAVEAVRGCAPGRASTGVLSADAHTCTIGADASIVFTGDVLHDTDDFGFDLAVAGSTCAVFSNAGDGVRSLATANHQATWELGDVARLTCLDGSVFEAAMLDVLACPGFSRNMGFVVVTDPDAIELSFLGPASNVDVFACAR